MRVELAASTSGWNREITSLDEANYSSLIHKQFKTYLKR